jgi:hypothetical protein
MKTNTQQMLEHLIAAVVDLRAVLREQPGTNFGKRTNCKPVDELLLRLNCFLDCREVAQAKPLIDVEGIPAEHLGYIAFSLKDLAYKLKRDVCSYGTPPLHESYAKLAAALRDESDRCASERIAEALAGRCCTVNNSVSDNSTNNVIGIREHGNEKTPKES